MLINVFCVFVLNFIVYTFVRLPIPTLGLVDVTLWFIIADNEASDQTTDMQAALEIYFSHNARTIFLLVNFLHVSICIDVLLLYG